MHVAQEFIVHTCPPLASLQCSLTTHAENFFYLQELANCLKQDLCGF